MVMRMQSARRWTPELLAKVSLAIQMLILIRLPLEYFRLRHLLGRVPAAAVSEPLLKGELFTALCAALAVGFFFAGRNRAVILIAAINIVGLIVYKIVLVS
jgi:hypothetical protein